ncbi:MAG TPA: protein-L-isoaspartate(D-aspartate) O-methyltransferase [Myxococcota bacterium]|nr:protein-L-isoaspartate(D-aspartate) O-methyltransferase [Myxococcota bacterium]
MDDGVRGARRSPGRADWAVPRRRMVERLAAAGIHDRRVLAALEAVPRHLLVPDALQSQAYRDAALPIGDGQTISAPGTVAAMSQALALRGHESVLEIGTGSGYQSAILSQLAARVVSVERVQRLAASARRSLDRLGIHNVLVYWGDGTKGRPADAPFDAIVVTAGGPRVPEPLLEQLALGGCLVGPFGTRAEQRLVRVRRDGPHAWSQELLGRARFVDLVGSHGWGG